MPIIEEIQGASQTPDPSSMATHPVHYDPDFLSGPEADDLFSKLLNTLSWRHDSITLFGKSVMQPRLVAFVADSEVSYAYSGHSLVRCDWTPELLQLKKRLEACCCTAFNSVLCNLYRTGNDSMGWHSDDEKSLGRNPTIASVSLGGRRVFKLRKKNEKGSSVGLPLGHGSLLVMQADCQHTWQHSLPKTKKLVQPRINLTFRNVRF